MSGSFLFQNFRRLFSSHSYARDLNSNGILHQNILRSFCTGAPKQEVQEGEESSGRDPRDRTVPVPVELSIRYLKSKAYETTYGTEPVWVPYRRNHRGGFAPRETRPSCIKNGFIKTGNPCPICRDEYLVLDPKNVDLLKQFVSPYNGEILKVGCVYQNK